MKKKKKGCTLLTDTGVLAPYFASAFASPHAYSVLIRHVSCQRRQLPTYILPVMRDVSSHSAGVYVRDAAPKTRENGNGNGFNSGFCEGSGWDRRFSRFSAKQTSICPTIVLISVSASVDLQYLYPTVLRTYYFAVASRMARTQLHTPQPLIY